MKQKPKLYVIRKYIRAGSVSDALKKDRITPAHECFLEDKWSDKELPSAIGFTSEPPEEG